MVEVKGGDRADGPCPIHRVLAGPVQVLELVGRNEHGAVRLQSLQYVQLAIPTVLEFVHDHDWVQGCHPAGHPSDGQEFPRRCRDQRPIHLLGHGHATGSQERSPPPDHAPGEAVDRHAVHRHAQASSTGELRQHPPPRAMHLGEGEHPLLLTERVFSEMGADSGDEPGRLSGPCCAVEADQAHGTNRITWQSPRARSPSTRRWSQASAPPVTARVRAPRSSAARSTHGGEAFIAPAISSWAM